MSICHFRERRRETPAYEGYTDPFRVRRLGDQQYTMKSARHWLLHCSQLLLSERETHTNLGSLIVALASAVPPNCAPAPVLCPIAAAGGAPARKAAQSAQAARR